VKAQVLVPFCLPFFRAFTLFEDNEFQAFGSKEKKADYPTPIFCGRSIIVALTLLWSFCADQKKVEE
jgi:hypothetical protein